MLPLRNTLRPEFGIFIFCQFFSAKSRLGRMSAVVQEGGIRENLFFSFGNSTRTAILQLVDPACAAAHEHVETRIWNFRFLSVFSAKLRLGRISAVVTGGGTREILFFRFAILLMKLRVFSRVG